MEALSFPWFVRADTKTSALLAGLFNIRISNHAITPRQSAITPEFHWDCTKPQITLNHLLTSRWLSAELQWGAESSIGWRVARCLLTCTRRRARAQRAVASIRRPVDAVRAAWRVRAVQPIGRGRGAGEAGAKVDGSSLHLHGGWRGAVQSVSAEGEGVCVSQRVADAPGH
eukprot:6744698-Prymnesium_polylepis.1